MLSDEILYGWYPRAEGRARLGQTLRDLCLCEPQRFAALMRDLFAEELRSEAIARSGIAAEGWRREVHEEVIAMPSGSLSVGVRWFPPRHHRARTQEIASGIEYTREGLLSRALARTADGAWADEVCRQLSLI